MLLEFVSMALVPKNGRTWLFELASIANVAKQIEEMESTWVYARVLMHACGVLLQAPFGYGQRSISRGVRLYAVCRKIVAKMKATESFTEHGMSPCNDL